MNILFFTESGCGVAAMLVQQYLSLKKINKSKSFAVISSEQQQSGLIDTIKDNGDYLLLEGLEKHKNFNYHSKKLRKYIITNEIDCVHVQTNWELILIAYTKLFLKRKIKTIYTVHSFRNHKNFVEAFVFRLLITIILFLFADKVICTCHFLKRKFSILSYKMILLPLGVSNNYFITEPIFNDSAKISLIYPAAFRVGKNQEMVIEAFAEYIKRSNDNEAILYLPGSGELFETVKELVKGKGLEKQIILPGICSISQLKELYAKSNIAVIASKSETFGLCIAEPFVLGKCILSRNVGVTQDIIVNGRNGFIFDNSDDLCEKLLYLSKDYNIIKNIGFRNFSEKSIFNWDSIMKKYIDIIS